MELSSQASSGLSCLRNDTFAQIRPKTFLQLSSCSWVITNGSSLNERSSLQLPRLCHARCTLLQKPMFLPAVESSSIRNYEALYTTEVLIFYYTQWTLMSMQTSLLCLCKLQYFFSSWWQITSVLSVLSFCGQIWIEKCVWFSKNNESDPYFVLGLTMRNFAIH